MPRAARGGNQRPRRNRRPGGLWDDGKREENLRWGGWLGVSCEVFSGVLGVLGIFKCFFVSFSVFIVSLGFSSKENLPEMGRRD